MSAAMGGNVGVMGTLVKEKVDLDFEDNFGYTALHIATDRGHKEDVRVLVAAGAKINSKSKFCAAIPLHFALENKEVGDDPQVIALLASPENVNEERISNETPMQISAP